MLKKIIDFIKSVLFAEKQYIEVEPKVLYLENSGEIKVNTNSKYEIIMKENWLQLEKAGNVVKVVAPDHTGRNERIAHVEFTVKGAKDLAEIRQIGKAEFVEIQEVATVSRTGGGITLTGSSNSSRLTFRLNKGDLPVELPDVYEADSAPTNNAALIVGDPGSKKEYEFSITLFGIPENKSTEELSRLVVVLTDNGQSGTCLITQLAAEAYIKVDPKVLEVPQEGGEFEINVDSNSEWGYEVV